MSMLNPPKKVTRRQELPGDQVVTTYARAVGYADKNRGLVIGAAVAAVAVLLLVAGYFWYQAERGERAHELMAPAVQAYEAGEFQAALDGTAGNPGLIEIADDYGRTNAGNLARFYTASALFQLERYDESLRYFEAYRKDRDLLGASAYAGEAAIHEIRGDHARAARLYERAAQTFPEVVTAPEYLQHAARNFEQAAQFDAARRAYTRIAEEYPESQPGTNVEFYQARLDAMEQAARS
jgi:tetratricopeptide (TPR) repeat protein